MSSENGWIPWDERKDVQKYVIVAWVGVDFYTTPPTEIYKYYYIGSIPKEYIADFEKEIEKAEEETLGQVEFWIRAIEQLNEQVINQALRFFVLHKDDKEGAVVYWWNLKKTYEKVDKLKYEHFISDSPAVPASAPVVNDSPADKTAKPKRQKATKKETQDAADLIVEYFNSGKRKFSVSIISNYLENKLRKKFDLSSKTFLGKIYAVLYYQKQNIPPRGWTVGRIEEAEKEVKHTLNRK